MSTEILKFINDDGPDYQALISLAGWFTSNPVISARLGAPISTRPGVLSCCMASGYWIMSSEVLQVSG